jgi:hypothetical protein
MPRLYSGIEDAEGKRTRRRFEDLEDAETVYPRSTLSAQRIVSGKLRDLCDLRV